MSSRIAHTVLLTLCLLAPCVLHAAPAEEWNLLLDLRGQWKFEIGDDREWSTKNFNDAGWENIFVPSPWEDEGFPGYDGYAWYRKHFTVPPATAGRPMFLHLGTVDDVCEVYVNGTLVGVNGTFPPAYHSAYDVPVRFPVAEKLLDTKGDNVIAVRVYDSQISGGITKGKVGLFEPENYLAAQFSLSGTWKFRTGDMPAWSEPGFDDRNWADMFVPSLWEGQGFKDYDGFAWYRMHFQVPRDLQDRQLILLLGLIDDLDETYLNGERIGRTGRMYDNPKRIHFDNEYRELRAYTVPTHLLREKGDNVIAVRVYDGYKDGGIYAGPIGLISRESYLEWKKHQPRPERDDRWNFFDIFR